MQDIYSFWRTSNNLPDSWLIYGKGPTFGLREAFNLDDFGTIALNHTIVEARADIFHAIDIDVIDDCQDSIRRNAKFILMAYHPHVRCKATGITLTEFIPTVPVLQEFESAGRLLYYDFFSGKTKLGLPKIHGSFSASAVVTLLGQLGVRTIRTLGIDGGKSYSKRFSYLNDQTLLANGHASFDSQFPEIERVVSEMNIDYKPLAETIRIFVGTDDTQMVGFQVLEHSIRKRTDWPVEVFPMRNMPLPQPKHAENKAGTGFSFNRFLIPKLAGYSGKAIYMDADMLVFDDISKLWNLPMGDNAVLCSTQMEYPKAWGAAEHRPMHASRHWKPGRQLSVMLLDCEQLDWDVENLIQGLDEKKYTYKQLMVDMCMVDQEKISESIPNSWNCLEWYEEGVSQNVHFTVVPTQPWKNDDNELTELWETAFLDAVRDGAIDMDLVKWSIKKGFVKPQLLPKAEQALSETVASPSADSRPGKRSEAYQLRRMLWDVMIKEYEERAELKYMRSSPSFMVEEALIRKPGKFAIRAAKAVARRAGLLR